MAYHTVWGVDIGNSAIKAVKMYREGNEARIVDFDIIDIQGGDEEGTRTARVQAAVQTLCTNHRFGDDPVFLSLPGDQCLFREFQLPPGSEGKIADLVQYEAKQQIPFPLDQVEMGWERYDDPAGGVGVELIVVRKNIVEEVLALTDQFKLRVQGVTVSPVAQFNFIQHEFQPQGATLILDAGYKGTDFVVMQGKHIYSRTIPIGGREITRALEGKFKVPYEKAEELKKNIGQSKQAEKILSVIEPTLRQLGAEIQRTIGFYKSKSRGQRVSQGYLMGHTFRLPRMAETLAAQIREAPMTVVEGMQRIQLDRSVNPGVFSNEFPTMAVAIGLGVQGLGLSEITVNLLPKDRVIERKVEEKRWWGILAAAAILLALFFSYKRATDDSKAIAALKTEVNELVAKADSQKKVVADVEKPFLVQRDNVQRLSRIPRDRGRLLHVFRDMLQLKNETGQPFFGERTKVYLANVYVSRIPIRYEQGRLAAPPSLGPGGSGGRAEMLRDSASQKGSSSIYGFLKDVSKNALDQPQGKRPDAPVEVVLSCEFQGNDADLVNKVLPALTTALKKYPEVKETQTMDRRVGFKRTEVVPRYNPNGQLDENNVARETAIEYSVFHVSFRWEPKDDPDIMPQSPGGN